jgi:hypothetical protein
MVTGTKFPEGDPSLTKQNEESHAVSSRNARHLLGAANDYRQVPVLAAEGLRGGKAWVSLYKSVDGGESWRSTPLGGCPVNVPQCNDATGLTAPLKALKPDFSADPTVRPGPYGTFFFSFIAGKRDTNADGVIAVQRFVDKNNDIQRATDLRSCTQGSPGCTEVRIPANCTGGPPACTVSYVVYKPAEDPILPDKMSILDLGTPGQFNDKPWNAADVPGRPWNAGMTCELLSWTKNRADVANVAETVPAFSVYVSYAKFVGQDPLNEHPQMHVSVSNDCGNTFSKQPIKLTPGNLGQNSGSNIAIDPLTGAVYIVWRNFDGESEIYLSKSTDGGKNWSKKPILVAKFNPYDQGTTGASFRTLAFPTIAVSVVGNTSRVHVAWSQRKAGARDDASVRVPVEQPGGLRRARRDDDVARWRRHVAGTDSCRQQFHTAVRNQGWRCLPGAQPQSWPSGPARDVVCRRQAVDHLARPAPRPHGGRAPLPRGQHLHVRQRSGRIPRRRRQSRRRLYELGIAEHPVWACLLQARGGLHHLHQRWPAGPGSPAYARHVRGDGRSSERSGVYVSESLAICVWQHCGGHHRSQHREPDADARRIPHSAEGDQRTEPADVLGRACGIHRGLHRGGGTDHRRHRRSRPTLQVQRRRRRQRQLHDQRSRRRSFMFPSPTTGT